MLAATDDDLLALHFDNLSVYMRRPKMRYEKTEDEVTSHRSTNSICARNLMRIYLPLWSSEENEIDDRNPELIDKGFSGMIDHF